MGSEEERAPRPHGRVCRRTWTGFTAASLFCGLVFCYFTVLPARKSAVSVVPEHAPLIDAVVLRNKQGVEVHVLATGASIHRLLLPDVEGVLADVALGMSTEHAYSDGSSPYFGAIAGRFANRIANATFTLDGRTHKLPVNEAGFPGSLHGGARGFDKVQWQMSKLDASQSPHRGDAVRLVYRSADGDEGYPGTLEAEVIYTLTNGVGSSTGVLLQEIRATSDQPTVVNLAQHSYFNLAGHSSGRSILDHELTLHASHVLPVDGHRIPTGTFLPVSGTPFDFTKPRAIGKSITSVHGPGWRAGYDNCFVLHDLGQLLASGEPAASAAKANGGGGGGSRRKRAWRALSDVRGLRRARMATANRPSADKRWWQPTPQRVATLRDPSSGRTMQISTDAPGLQLYTSNFLDGTLQGTKDGAIYQKYAGVCLETESFPDGPNRAEPANGWPTGILRPGETYTHTTEYRFSAR